MVMAPLKKYEDEEEVYISPLEAQKELSRRKQSTSFHETMETIKSELWKNNQPPLPALNGCKPKAYLWRHIASARFEDLEFQRIAESNGFAPCWLEYTSDKFSTRNQAKIDLCQMLLYMGKGKKGGPKLEKYNPVNISLNENRIFREIITSQGEPLTEFHHRIRKIIFSQKNAESYIDISDWIKNYRGKSENNYIAFLALFIFNGVLYEDFHSPFSQKAEEARQLNNFKNKVFLPAWRKVKEITGEQPLIVRLPSKPDLSWYPGILKEKVNLCPLIC